MLAPRWLRQADSFAGLTKPSPSIQLWSINGFSLSRVLEEFDNSSAAWRSVGCGLPAMACSGGGWRRAWSA